MGGGSSHFPWIEEGGGLGRDELMFDVDADFEADDIDGQGPGAPRCKSCKLRFPPLQAKLEAYTRKIDDNFEDTYL